MPSTYNDGVEVQRRKLLVMSIEYWCLHEEICLELAVAISISLLKTFSFFPSFHLSWWYDSISIKRRMRGVNLGRKMIILIHVTILWWIFFSNLLSNYVHQLVMHLALMPLENFLHIIYPIQWHLYMQLCTMSNNIQNEKFEMNYEKSVLNW